MLTILIIYLTALLASSTTANLIRLSQIVQWERKGCKGNRMDIGFNTERAGSDGHCFDHMSGASFSGLATVDGSCKRAYVIAHLTDDCSDPDHGYQLMMRVPIAADACVDVVGGYGSFKLGCEY